ncbi:phosphoribosylamine--glycine ligase [Roseivirga sp. BDSF3-8]|uniref:phosphoribosylamine--glycine ligase n=1 Tax=Roseivirga sp. BDSF3-8 TaxID=3241598 RepID=UPI0035319FAF
MNVLILGAGGREHALAWKIKQSPECGSLFIAPGNAGTATEGTNIELSLSDFSAIGDFVLKNDIDLVVVGPEAPLVDGFRDYMEGDNRFSGVGVIGPGKTGAILEGSKDFSKGFMERNGVPAASSRTFTAIEIEQAEAYVRQHSLPVVLKADGLAAGKGVIISPDHEDALSNLKDMLVGERFGEASAKVVIEQYLDGIELSVFVLTDGEAYKILPAAKDYKRIGEGDTGPNTGGMGAVSPVPFANEEFMRKVEEKVIRPTISGLKAEGIPYTGFIFFGLMNVDGEPYVIEYNVRMGDPETQVVLPRISSDLLKLLKAAADGELASAIIETSPEVASTVVLVSGGYPGPYQKGKQITGLDAVPQGPVVFHAGTRVKDEHVLTSGGRVMAMTGLGKSMQAALKQSYEAANAVSWEGITYRKDIGKDLEAFSG